MEEKSTVKNWNLARKADEKADELRKRLEVEQGMSEYDNSETSRCWRDACTEEAHDRIGA